MNSDHQRKQIDGICTIACPSPKVLLRFADQTLRRRRDKKVRKHLENCDSCAALTGLMNSPTVDRAPTELPQAARKEDRDLVARRLGFGGKRPLAQRLFGLADGLWQVRTPILVPVSVTAMLLFLLLPASRPVIQRNATPLVYHFTEIRHLISTDHTLRSAAGISAEYQAAAGSLILLQHYTSRTGLDAGEPVTLTVLGGPGHERVLLANVSDNGLIEVPLVISRPGNYRIRISRSASGSILATLTCTVTAPSPDAP